MDPFHSMFIKACFHFQHEHLFRIRLDVFNFNFISGNNSMYIEVWDFTFHFFHKQSKRSMQRNLRSSRQSHQMIRLRTMCVSVSIEQSFLQTGQPVNLRGGAGEGPPPCPVLDRLTTGLAKIGGMTHVLTPIIEIGGNNLVLARGIMMK